MKEPTVRKFMTTSLVTLKPEMSIYAAIEVLLKNKISGACVVGPGRVLKGVLSEKDCLRLFAHGAFNQLPNAIVGEYMSKEITAVTPNDGLFAVADLFLKNTFRRLPVLEDGKLVGQVSRRDVLTGSRKMWETLYAERPWTDSKFIPEQVQAALETGKKSPSV
jgi:CBS domain-containing protein